MNRDQFYALLWLRWRLTVNQWNRRGAWQAILLALIVGCGVLMAVSAAVGGLVLGIHSGSSFSPHQIRWLWDGIVGVFLLLWSMGIVSEIQRSEVIDLVRLLHLPVSWRGAFVMNYLASHFSFSVAVFLPATLALAAGHAMGRSAAMALLAPAVLAFLFMVTAWTYCLRGWLAAQMFNPRRRRALVMGITLAFVIIFQLPSLLMNIGMPRKGKDGKNLTPEELQHRKARWESAARTAHQWIPPLWLPRGAEALAQGNAAPVLWGTLGMATLGCAGLAQAHRAALRFYRGTHSAKRIAPINLAPLPGTRRPSDLLVAREIRWLNEETSAVALAGLRCYQRAPEVKMMLVMNLVVIAMLVGSIFLRERTAIPETLRAFLPLGVVVVTFFGALQLLFNQFGFDRDGFRSLVLAPVSRRNLLLGRNLSFLPVAALVFLLMLALLIPVASLRMAHIIQALGLFGMGFCLVNSLGNLASIWVPYRMPSGSLKAAKTPAANVVLMIVFTLIFPLFMAPMAIPPAVGLLVTRTAGWPGEWIAATLAIAGAAVATWAYRWLLIPTARMLQRREFDILQVVTQVVD